MVFALDSSSCVIKRLRCIVCLKEPWDNSKLLAIDRLVWDGEFLGNRFIPAKGTQQVEVMVKFVSHECEILL